MDATDQNQGTDVDILMEFYQSLGFATRIPQEVIVVEDSCDLTPDFEISLNPLVMETGLGPIDIGGLTTFVIRLIESFLGGFICQFIAQAGYLSNGDPGALNVALNYANSFLNDMRNAVDPVPKDEEDAIEANYLTSSELNDAIDFSVNPYLPIVSVAMNDWLGTESNNPSYTGLAINEMIERVLESPTGSFTLPPEFSVPTLVFENSMADISIVLKTFELQNLNTFSSFSIMENGYDGVTLPKDRHNFTLTHKVDIGQVDLEGLIEINLKDSDWVTASTTPTELTFTGGFSTTATNIILDVATLLAVNPNELLATRISELMGEYCNGDTLPCASLLNRMKSVVGCASPMFYAIVITSMAIQLDPLTDPTLIGIPDLHLEQFLNDAMTIVLNTAKAAFNNDLPNIVQHWLRPKMNEVIEEHVVLPGKTQTKQQRCPDYTPNLGGGGNPLIAFADSDLFNMVTDDFINKVLGGTPTVTETGTDINDLLDAYIEHYLQVYSINYDHPQVGDFDIDVSLSIEGGEDTANAAGASMTLETIFIRDFDSIYEFQVTPGGVPAPQEISLNVKMGDGAKLLPQGGTVQEGLLTTGFAMSVVVPSQSVNEAFSLSLGLGGLSLQTTAEVQVYEERLVQLQLQDLVLPQCLLATLHNVNIDPMTISFNTIDLTLTRTQTSSSALGTAIGNLAADLNPTPGAKINSMVNFILKTILGKVQDGVNGFDYQAADYENCKFVENPLQESVLSLLSLSQDLVDDETLRHIIDVGLKSPQPPPQSPSQVDQDIIDSLEALELDNLVYFDWLREEASGIIWPKIFSLIGDSASYRNFLVELGNLPPDAGILAEIFDTNGNGVVTATIPFAKYFPEYFIQTFDRFVENFAFRLDEVQITGLQYLDLDTIQFMIPQSTFVLKNYLKFTDQLEIKVNMSVNFPSIFIDDATGSIDEILQDRLIYVFSVDKLTVDNEIAVALDLDYLINVLTIGHFIQVTSTQIFSLTDTYMECARRMLFPAANAVHISKLIVDMETISPFTIISENQQLMSTSVEQFIVAMSDLFLVIYQDNIKDVTQGLVRMLLNEYLFKRVTTDYYNKELEQIVQCPETPKRIPLFNDLEILNFQQSNVVDYLLSFETFLLGSNNDYFPLNTIIDAALGNGRRKFVDPLFELFDFQLDYRGNNYGRIAFSFGRIFGQQVGTVNALTIIEPLEEQRFKFSIAMDGPMTIGGDLSMEYDNVFLSDKSELTDDLLVGLTMTDFQLDMDMTINLNVRDLLELRASTLTNLTESICAITAINLFRFNDFVVKYEEVEATISCNGVCDSPVTKPLAVGTSLSSNSNEFSKQFIKDLIVKSTDAISSDLLQEKIDLLLKASSQFCSSARTGIDFVSKILHANLDDPQDVSAPMGFTALGIGMLGLAGVLAFVPKRHRRTMKVELEKNPGAGRRTVEL